MSFVAAASAVLVALVWVGRNWYIDGPPGSRAHIDSIAGQAYRIGPAGDRPIKIGDEIAQGEFIRTAANSQAKVRLFDGSQVEMNQRAELAVSATAATPLSISIKAASSSKPHIVTQAICMLARRIATVAVTGTVFSVNSGTKGSRVSVIEGEVHVKHSGLESILHSGDQVATTPSVGLVPVSQEIGWSNDLNHELALLAEFSTLREKLRLSRRLVPVTKARSFPCWHRTPSFI